MPLSGSSLLYDMAIKRCVLAILAPDDENDEKLEICFRLFLCTSPTYAFLDWRIFESFWPFVGPNELLFFATEFKYYFAVTFLYMSTFV